jgi:thiamine biosynthesis protein ThiC
LESQPNWSPLSSFPHFENTRFRAFIRNLFSNYTQVPVEQIFRSSENYKTEQWLTDNAVSQGVHTVDFSQIMPGVSSMVEKFTAPGAGYLKVTDRGGVNLYTWREAPAARPDAPGM